jgi:hypothetical protein
VSTRAAEGVLLTGVYGSGKSSVAEEIAYLLEQQGEPYALLDLDYLSWAGAGTGDRAGGSGVMLQNLSAVAANYRAGIRRFVLACLSAIPVRWPATSPAAAATICVRRRHRSGRRRVLASRMWSSATTVPPGSQRAL